MRKTLVYDRESAEFRFVDDYDIRMAALATNDKFDSSGTFEFPAATAFPTFAAGQLLDALYWASSNGKRV